MFVIAVVACSAIITAPTDTSDEAAEPAQEQQQEPAPEEPVEEEQQEPEPIPEPEPVNLSGTGPQATDTFELQDGLVVARMAHQGESNFIVHLLNDGAHDTH